MNILDGQSVSEKILSGITEEILQIKSAGKRIPRLDIILVGNDYGSEKYVGMKEKIAKKVGINGVVHRLDHLVTH
jgi:methylenetetrahydrofolate dehydrogenase (NADP+)/methenyltetrahydrofolate cyclohydrolase